MRDLRVPRGFREFKDHRDRLGADGTDGADGADGKTVLNGAADPDAGLAWMETFTLTP